MTFIKNTNPQAFTVTIALPVLFYENTLYQTNYMIIINIHTMYAFLLPWLSLETGIIPIYSYIRSVHLAIFVIVNSITVIVIIITFTIYFLKCMYQ